MAALVYILCDLTNELLRVGYVFINSGFSVHECINFLITKRKNLLNEQYIKNFVMGEDNILLQMICDYDGTPTTPQPNLEVEPDVVFSCSNLRNLSPGTCFTIQGAVMKTCERFSINLVMNTVAKDIALHFNPRLPQNYIVRNCRVNNNWGIEEVTSPLPFSLRRGKPFTVTILITDNEYLISVNGKHFSSFQHRLPYSKVFAIQVKGDVTNIRIDQTIIKNYPDTVPENEPIPINIEYTDICEGFMRKQCYLIFKESQLLDMPYCGKLVQPFVNGYRLHVFGRIKLLPHSFFVNLQIGNKIWPHPMILFHLNPRFANVGSKHVICRNTWLNGKWDKEERTEANDFMPGKEFLLTIHCCDSSYHIYVNDQFIAEYKFREDPKDADIVYIQGDIKLSKVLIEAPPKRDILTNRDYV